MEIKTPEEAYEKQQNHGLVETDNKGKTEFILNCPQPYKVDNVSFGTIYEFSKLVHEFIYDWYGSSSISQIIQYFYRKKNITNQLVRSVMILGIVSVRHFTLLHLMLLVTTTA